MKASQLIPGDTLRRPDGTSEVVRNVFLVVQLANGMDHRYAVTDDVQIIEQTQRPPEQPARVLPGSPAQVVEPVSRPLEAPPQPPAEIQETPNHVGEAVEGGDQNVDGEQGG